MRELKFRMWNKTHNFMRGVGAIDWNYGVVYAEKPNDYKYALSSVELMQYLGFKDKNGKEYFEGDVYKYPNGNAGYGDKSQPDDLIACIKSIEELYDDEFLKGRLQNGEIIGNFSENPELLNMKEFRGK